MKLAGPRCTTNEEARPLKNMRGPIKLCLYNHVWNSIKLSKFIFGLVKDEKFSWCLVFSIGMCNIKNFKANRGCHHQPVLWLVCPSSVPCRSNSFDTWRLRQNGCHFPDIFDCVFLNENIWMLIDISWKFVPQGPINNIPALVQIMAWHWPGNKPLSEPMIVSFFYAYMRQGASMS